MNWRMGLLFLILMGVLFPPSSFTADGKPNQAEVAALIEKARVLVDIRAPGSPPFRLKARARTIDPDGNWVDGSYLLIWAAPEKWRQEISHPGFNEVEVMAGGILWKLRNVPYRTREAFGWEGMLSTNNRFHFDPKGRVTRVGLKKYDGINLKCVKTFPPKGIMAAEREWCFDTVSGALQRKHYAGAGNRMEYGDYTVWGEKVFPRTLRSFSGGKLTREVEVQELVPDPQPDPSLFVPPSEAEAWPTCTNPVPHKFIGTSSRSSSSNFAIPYFVPSAAVPLSFPMESIVYFVVGVDGRVRNLKVLNSRGGKAAAAFEDSLKGLQFQPATCYGAPVPSETIIGGRVP